jgi:Domain of unknown function (DUF6457)
MDARAWLAAYAEELGVPAPGEDEIERLLALAGVAAHSSERIAAPIACWLAACAGAEPERALMIARRIGGEDG